MLIPLRKIATLVAALAVVLPVAGCGEEEESGEVAEVVEGEPLEIGELTYNVAITRFLNPNIVEDKQYVVGQPPEPKGQSYLGVFLLIDNKSDSEEQPTAGNYAVVDASQRVYEPVESESDYAMDIGQLVPAEGRVPGTDSTASFGPTQGALLLFLVDDNVSEERPLELEISSVLGDGIVELDI